MRLLTLLAIAAAAIALTGCNPEPEASNDPAATSPKSTMEKTGTAPTPAPEANAAAPTTR